MLFFILQKKSLTMQLEKRGDQMMGFDSVKKYVEWLAKENGLQKKETNILLQLMQSQGSPEIM